VDNFYFYLLRLFLQMQSFAEVLQSFAKFCRSLQKKKQILQKKKQKKLLKNLLKKIKLTKFTSNQQRIMEHVSMDYLNINIPKLHEILFTLTSEEKAAFILLCTHYFKTEKPISNDLKRLSKLLTINNLEVLKTVLDLHFEYDEESETYDCELLRQALSTAQNNQKRKQEIAKVRAEAARKKAEKYKLVKNISANALQNSANAPLNININNKDKYKNLEKSNQKRKPNFSEADFSFAKHLQSWIANISSIAGEKFNLDKSANDIRLIRERDKVSLEELSKIVGFAFSGNWWTDKITSTKFLRNNLGKIQAQMNGTSAKQNNSNSNSTDSSSIKSVGKHTTTKATTF